MVGWQPITAALGNTPGPGSKVAAVISVVYLAFLCFPVFGVKEDLSRFQTGEGHHAEADVGRPTKMTSSCGPRCQWRFMVGYCTTTGFATYYMQYLFGNINMYAVLAGVCGVIPAGRADDIPAVFQKAHQKAALYRCDDPGRRATRCFSCGAPIIMIAIAAAYYLCGAGLHTAF